MIRLAIALCVIVVGVSSGARGERPRCWDIDATTHPLIPAWLRVWQRVPHGLVACPVYKGSGQLLWWIIAVAVDAIEGDWWDDPTLFPMLPGTLRRQNFPMPSIVNPKGDVIGRLSACYPTCGAPSRTDIYLSHWVNGFPHVVSSMIWNNRVMNSYATPPLRWNEKKGVYEQIGTGQYDLRPPTMPP